MYSSAVLLHNILLLVLLLLTISPSPAAASGVEVPELNDPVISSSSMSTDLTKSLLSGRIMSAVNDVVILSVLGVWGVSDTDGDTAGVAMTGMWLLSLIKGDLLLNCGSLLPNRVLKT